VVLISALAGFVPRIPEEVASWIFRGLEYLILITLAVDGLCFLLIYLLERLVGAMRGQEVEYH